MADSLVLTGVKDVKKHTGTEMLLTRPKRGGDTHSVKEWWKGGGVSTCYVQCTIFDVTVGGDTCKLVLDSNMSTNLRIDHDGSFGFTFFGSNEIPCICLLTPTKSLSIMSSSISGGRDDCYPCWRIKPVVFLLLRYRYINVTANGCTDGATETYSVTTPDATATPLTLAWSVTGDAVINGGSTGTSVDVDLSAGSATITCTVTSTDPGVTDSPATGDISVTTT